MLVVGFIFFLDALGRNRSPFLVYKTKVINILPKHFEIFMILFSRIPAKGIRTRIMRKYKIEAN